MALHVPRTTYQSMMKDGAKHYKGLEEAVFRNIKMCKEFAKITRSSFGPQGMNKIVVNHLDRRFVTNDATTIINELEIQHPAAKIVVMAAKMQEQEVGDGTNLVVQFASELLNEADGLLRMGLTPNDIIDGYQIACDYAIEELQKLTVHKVTDFDSFEQMREIVATAIMSKQEAHHEFLSKLITEACMRSKSKNSQNFSVDNVSTVKILGSGLMASENVNGLVFVTSALGQIIRVQNAKIAVFTVAFDLMNTETKGTVLLNTANELSSFTAGEESLMGKMVEQLKGAGVNLVVTSDKVSDQALDYANRHGIMVIKLTSKFDIQRLCRATTAVSLPTMRIPNPEELGHCSEIYITEFGNSTCCIFKQELEESSMSTIVLRGSSMGLLDDIDRAVDDGVNAFKMALRENGYVSGCGSTELTLGNRIVQLSKTKTDLSQYSIDKFGQSLHIVPKILSENAGFSSSEAMSKLQAQHISSKNDHIGLDIFGDQIQTLDANESHIYDNAYVKKRAIMQATHAAITILAVDQIIMAKPAGGPRVRAPGPMDQD